MCLLIYSRKSPIVSMPGHASDKCGFQGDEWAAVETLMKTTLAGLAELIKEDASLKLAQDCFTTFSLTCFLPSLSSSPLLSSYDPRCSLSNT